MSRALVGYTGFVGSNLLRQAPFDDLYNSSNVEEIAGRRYELLACAGARAEKWLVNQDPDTDATELGRLKTALSSVRADRVVLISTADVYPHPVAVNEDSPIAAEVLSPYGRHRLELERWMQERLPTMVVRLPGLFGPGLKKNVVFDFLHDNQLEKIHADARFQFYDLGNLWADVERTLANGIDLINLATEPVPVRDVAREVFDREFDNRPATEPANYDFRSKHAHLYGGHDGYLYGRDEVLRAMRRFVAETRPAT